MKNLQTLFFLLISTAIFSQSWEKFPQLGGYNRSDCGTWVVDTITITGWSTIDTINYNKKGDTNYVCSEWKRVESNMTYAIYCPCGCGWNDEKYQNRISDRGILQQRKEITTHKYIPKPQSDYDKKLSEIKEKAKSEEKHNTWRKSPNFMLFRCDTLKCDSVFRFKMDTTNHLIYSSKWNKHDPYYRFHMQFPDSCYEMIDTLGLSVIRLKR